MPKPKLCQVVAVVSGKKATAQKVLTEAHNHRLKPDLLSGLYRNYRPLKEDGDVFPPEIKRVQSNVPSVIAEVRAPLVEMLDVVLTQDTGNTHARADISIDGKAILADVPVTYLMFLEKQATDMETFVDKLPTLDPSEDWHEDKDVGGYATRPYETLRTAKVMKTHVSHPPTDHHPAQCQVYQVDETVGTWTNVKKSGAIRPQDKAAMLGRVRKLKEAIKSAREQANSSEVEPRKAGDAILGYVFGN